MKFTDIPTERTTASTDAILALLALSCAFYLYSFETQELWKRKIWILIFGFIALSSTLGAVVHGFALSPSIKYLIWQALFLILGLTVALFAVGGVYDLQGYIIARQFLPIMLTVGVGFYIFTHLYSGNFFIFIVYATLVLLFALSVYLWLAINGKLLGAKFITLGIFISIIAAILQSIETISIKFIWEFDHNGIYHILQIVGLLCLVAGLRQSLLVPR
ncbi:MAG: hypothetical protein HY268_08335 [Deltaproteobacteria bacterium]|nr:hypothetical protein [Deltaproteobacteria bacterium]